jgi:hypothetical protein
MRPAVAKTYSMGNTTMLGDGDVHPSLCDRESAEVSCHGLGGSRYPIQESRSAKLELVRVDRDIEGRAPDLLRTKGLDADSPAAAVVPKKRPNMVRRFIWLPHGANSTRPLATRRRQYVERSCDPFSLPEAHPAKTCQGQK